MTTNRPIVYALAAVVAAAVIWLLLGSDPTRPAPDAAGGAAGAPVAGTEIERGAENDTAATGAEIERVVVTPAADGVAPVAARATLRVTAVWPDAQPAADVIVFLRHGNRGMPYEPFARGRTDVDGVAFFDDVPLGPLRLSSGRGDREKTEVEPGDNEFRFELEGGVAVRGKVVDPGGGAVGGAQIWMQTFGYAWSSGRVVGAADDGGAFTLAHLPAGASLGAFAAGFGPSPLVDLDLVDHSNPPAEVVLQLSGDGGTLLGRVTDAAGEAIVGAAVVAGARPRNIDHRGSGYAEQWTARYTETDDDGRFALVSLKTGAIPVAVRADGYGIWRSEATIAADVPTTLAVQLQAGATITGRVTDGAGAPAAEATIRAYDREPRTTFLAGGQIDFDEEFGYVGNVSDVDGNYRVEGVSPGTVHIFAQEKFDRSEGKTLVWVRAALEVAPASDVTWDPVLEAGRQIAGVVLYRDGFPFPGLFVTLTDERTGAAQTFNTGRSAEFRFCCLDASTYSLRIQVWLPQGGADFVTREGLVPDRGRLEVRADFDKPVKAEPGTVIGRIDDRAGRIRNPGAVSVTLHVGSSSWRSGGEITDGAFRLKDVAPGSHRVSLVEGATVLASTDAFEVTAGSTVDAGVLVTEPGGALRITFRRGAAAAECEPTIVLRRDGDPVTGSNRITIGRADEYVADNLTPGDYDISCFGSEIKSHKARARVVAGVTNEATAEVRRCALARLEVWFPTGHDTAKTWRYRVTGADGELLIEREGDYRTRLQPYPAVIAATPGRWHVEYTTDDGLRGAAEFTIGADYADVKGRIDLTKR